MIGCSKDVKTDLSPAEHVTESIEQTMVGNIDLTGKVNFNLDEATLMESEEFADVPVGLVGIVNNLSFVYNYQVKSDRDAKTFDLVGDYDVNYSNNPLLQMGLIFNNNEFGFALKNFYDKYFIFDFETILKQAMEEAMYEDLSQIELQKYIEIILASDTSSLEGNEKYNDLIKTHLEAKLSEGLNEEITYESKGETITEHVLTYEYDFNFQDYMKLFMDILEEAKSDQALKDYTKEVLTALIDELYTSEDYLVLGGTEEEVMALKEELDNNFEEGWQSFFDEMLAEYDSMDTMFDDLDQDAQEIFAIYDAMTIKISINKDSIIKRVAVSLDYKGFGYKGEFIVNAIGDAVVIEDRSSKYINVFDYFDFEGDEVLKNKEELAGIIKEFMVSAMDEMVNGQGFNALLDDLTPFEEEFGMSVQDVKTSLEMAQVYVKNMTEEEIIEMLDNNMYTGSYDDTYDYDIDDDYYTELPELDRIAMISDLNTGDQYVKEALGEAIDFNTSDMGIEYVNYESTLESVNDDIQIAIDQGADLIFINATNYDEEIAILATTYPEVHFVMMEGYPDYFGDNMSILDYYNEESAYVAGYVAALTSQTGKIGFIGGIEDIYTMNYGVSFEDGAQAADSNIQVEMTYLGSTTDESLVEPVVKEMTESGVDIIYNYAGALGENIIDLSDAYAFKFIGNNSDYGIDKAGYLTTTYRNYPYIVYNIVTDYVDYAYVSTYYSYGIYEDGLYLSMGNLSEEVIESMSIIVDQIKTGELYIPTYYGE